MTSMPPSPEERSSEARSPEARSSEASLGLPFAGCEGRGVRVAVIDSGVHARHPHISGVSGGVSIGPEGVIEQDSYVDRLGHGTAASWDAAEGTR